MLGRCRQLIEFLVLFHTYLRGNHGSWRVFNTVFQIVLRIVNILLFSHVWAMAMAMTVTMTMTHVRVPHWHLSYSTYRPDLINGRAIIVVRVSWMIGSHGGSRLWRFTTMSVSGLWMGSIVVWSSGSRQDEILSQMRHGLVQTNYRMSVKITWTMFPHTILSAKKQDNSHRPTV